jgi:UDP:flavonoid glycosyltransferase YjiC (YdhE family)
MFAARDLNGAEAVLGTSGIPYFQAPANFSPRHGNLHSYAEILASTAFNELDELTGRARAWRGLYALLEPDILVCDHSPTALLAARGLPIHRVATGNGFALPPDVAPLPDLRSWDPAKPADLHAHEAATLERVNTVLERLGAPRLTRLAELLGTAHQALFTLKELDCYADLRPDAAYWGAPRGPGGAAPRWPEGEGKRVFFYSQLFENIAAVLARLATLGHRLLIYVPRLPEETRAALQSERVHVADTLMDMDKLAQECDCAVMGSGHGTTTAMLLAGKPVVLLPQHLEMLLIAKGLEKSGAGLVASTDKLDDINEKSTRLLQQPVYGERARMIAAGYRSKVGPEQASLNFQALIARLAAEAP